MKTCELPQEDRIKSLREITDDLYETSMQYAQALLQTPYIMEYATEGDPIKAVGLINIPGKFAIMVLYMAQGQVFTPHSHPAREWGYLLEGELELRTNGDIRVMGPGEFFCYGPEESHGGKALKDLRLICLSEDGEGYPSGQFNI